MKVRTVTPKAAFAEVRVPCRCQEICWVQPEGITECACGRRYQQRPLAEKAKKQPA